MFNSKLKTANSEFLFLKKNNNDEVKVAYSKNPQLLKNSNLFSGSDIEKNEEGSRVANINVFLLLLALHLQNKKLLLSS